MIEKTSPSPLTDAEKAAGVCRVTPYRYVPPFAHKTAYHWIRRYCGAPAIPLWWNAEWHKNGANGWGQYAEPDRECQWEYCGPCPFPGEVDEQGRVHQGTDCNNSEPYSSITKEPM